MELTIGSLFSGCGGLDLGFHNAGYKVKWMCESDKWCNKILSKNWPDIPVHPDANNLEAEKVDILIGGFPCQPVSTAGRKDGVDDPRWLWPAFDRAIRKIQPKYVVVENVLGLFSRGFGDVLGSLAVQGYDAEWFCLQSSDIGAPHRRKRVYILASNSGSERRWKVSGETSRNEETSRQQKIDNIIGGTGEGRFQTTSITDTISRRFKKRQQGWKLQLLESVSESTSDSNGQYDNRSVESRERRRIQFADSHFGDYVGAIRRWEEIFRIAPNPKDDKGRLNPVFVEWMMGFPEGWTEGVSKTQRLKMLGNAVQVQCAEVVGNLLKSKVKYE